MVRKGRKRTKYDRQRNNCMESKFKRLKIDKEQQAKVYDLIEEH